MEVALRHITLLLLITCLSACSGQAVFPDPPPRAGSYQLDPPADAPLARITGRLTAAHRGLSGVYPVTSAQNALAVRLAAIRSARSSIDIQYFIFRRDETGLLLTRELIEAANRGVRIRFLLDDFTTGDADRVLALLDLHPNIQIRLFNPFPHKGPRALELLADFPRLHRRMHNKSLTADNRVSFIGGRNLSNQYFGIDKTITFGDLDLLAIGPVVSDISRQFDLYWNSRYSFPVSSVIDYRPTLAQQQDFVDELNSNAQQLLASDYGRSLERSPVIRTLSDDDGLWYWGKTLAVYDPPDKITLAPPEAGRYAERDLLWRINAAKQQLIIISPYVLPGPYYLGQLIAAAQRGVEVHILTASLSSSDMVLVHGAYRKYRKPLLEAGIHLYEMSNARKYKLDNWREGSRSLLHAKAFAVDKQTLYVGSLNLDPRSIYLNTELGLLIESPQLTGKVAENFIENIPHHAYRLELRNGSIYWHREDGEVLTRDPGASLLQRLGSRIGSWLPIEHLL